LPVNAQKYVELIEKELGVPGKARENNGITWWPHITVY
jgi:hypothetical protein